MPTSQRTLALLPLLLVGLTVGCGDGPTPLPEPEVPLGVEPAALTLSGEVGEPLTGSFTATGGEGDVAWAVVSGAFPEGFTQRPEGRTLTVEGSALGAGDGVVEIEATDARGAMARAMLRFEVEAASPDLTIVTESLPEATPRIAYEAEIRASGGSGNDYRWSISGGQLPTGCFLRSEGTPATVIAGRPRTEGTRTFTLRVVDDQGGSAERSFTIEVVRPVPELTAQLRAWPQARVGQPFVGEVSAIGGTEMGYAWSVIAGMLPPGLAFAPTGTPVSTIAGTPTEAGQFNFTFRVEDSDGNRDSQSTFIRVDP